MTASGDRRFAATHRRYVLPAAITRATVGGSTCRIVVGVRSSGQATPPSQRGLVRAELLRIALRGQRAARPRTVGVEHDADGAPALSPPHTGSVSFSYDGLWAVVAISRGEGRIGVDIQVPRKVSPTVLRRFAPDLATRAGDRSTYSEFARRWAAREAAGKAAGTGLRGELLRTALPAERAGRDFGATYLVLDGWTFPALSLAHKD